MGGYRGYGPTHSQTLEKLFFGVFNLEIFAFDLIHDQTSIWKKMISNIQKSPFVVNKYAALASYLLLALGLAIFLIPNIRKEHILSDSLYYGGLLGLVIYGVFDFTNLAIIKRYNINIALIDMAWGGILFTIASYISKLILVKLQ